MTWWYAAKFDKRRMRRELREMKKHNPLVGEMWHALCLKGDPKDLDFVRLQLADLAEEDGRPVLAKMIREWMTCSKPRKRRKVRR